ncbi:MAG: protein kinase, partial [Phycisphaeraceae bacterium]
MEFDLNLQPDQLADLLQLGIDPDPPASEVGTNLALVEASKKNYRPIAHIGEGGFCDVWCAVNVNTRSLVALKTIRTDHDEANRDRAIAMLRSEAGFISQFNDPRIVRMIDVGGDAASSYIALEYLASENIYIHCEMESLDVNARIELFLKIVEAAALLHEKGVVH